MFTVVTRNNVKGHQIGYMVVNAETHDVVCTFNNRDFGGVSFFRRALTAAQNQCDKLNQGLN